jgi:hypothetical protein
MEKGLDSPQSEILPAKGTRESHFFLSPGIGPLSGRSPVGKNETPGLRPRSGRQPGVGNSKTYQTE